MVGFYRVGYGQSDPNPNRPVKSAMQDVEGQSVALCRGLQEGEV